MCLHCACREFSTIWALLLLLLPLLLLFLSLLPLLLLLLHLLLLLLPLLLLLLGQGEEKVLLHRSIARFLSRLVLNLLLFLVTRHCSIHRLNLLLFLVTRHCSIHRALTRRGSVQGGRTCALDFKNDRVAASSQHFHHSTEVLRQHVCTVDCEEPIAPLQLARPRHTVHYNVNACLS
jgi:hypothetical protein